jgi:hypothetical protein
MIRLKILIACEYSGTVREAFNALGHDAMSCDILPTDRPGNHYQGDVRDVLADGWDLMICHPPCTYLSVSGIHWNDRGRGWEETDKAFDFVRLLMGANIPHIALENPVSIISSKIRKPDQIIQPHQFGHDASKATCLWLKNLPKLQATESIAPRVINGKSRWGNQCDSGQNKLAPSKDRWKIRSTTYSGIAEAMAAQWSAHVLSSRTNSPTVNAATNLGALFTWNTTATADASGHATPKTKDGNSKSETESSTEYVLCPPGDASILMRAIARQ